eukprot:749866-Hanusia_phi.AAC.1
MIARRPRPDSAAQPPAPARGPRPRPRGVTVTAWQCQECPIRVCPVAASSVTQRHPWCRGTA